MEKLFETKTLAVLGVGNMGKALLQGIVNAKLIPVDRIVVTDTNTELLMDVQKSMGVRTSTDNAEAVKDADMVLLCVKPQMMAKVVEGIRSESKSCKLFISIAAGVTCQQLEQGLGEVPVVRVMPNTPALIGEGMSGVAAGSYAQALDVQRAEALCGVVGKVVAVHEKQLDAVTGVSGSGPAYVFTFIEGLIEGGVAMGLSLEDAKTLSVQTVIGAAKLVEQSDEDTAVLRSRVTSPGGTTLAGLQAMDIDRFKSIIHETVKAAAMRSEELGK